ncbi:MAG TPA: serine/threonine-protein kinase, partial [Polyangiaceae bacterium]
IVQIFDFGRDESRGLYMVIEYLEGEDLEVRLGRERWISEADTAIIGLQVARGLAKAHAAGIIHRDLKPANIFLLKRDDGSVHAKILDFGISKFETECAAVSLAEPTLTAYGTTLGTPQYMSPEQCEGKLELDVRTDIWGLSAVLYEMVAGEPAISDAGGHIATMQRIVRQDVPKLATRADWVSPVLADVIDAGLTRDRSARIPNATTLALRLVEAYPNAGSRPSIGTLVRNTDVSELGPVSEVAPPTEAAPSTVSDPAMRVAGPASPRAAAPASPRAAPSPGQAAIPPPALSDTGNPASADPPSSADDGVAIFARGELPSEIVALRKQAAKKRES